MVRTFSQLTTRSMWGMAFYLRGFSIFLGNRERRIVWVRR